MTKARWIQLLSSAAVLAACAPAARAQSAAAATASAQPSSGATIETVVVTARQRQETDLAAPVSLTAVSGAELQRQNITNLFDLAAHIPNLSISNGASGSGIVLLRGVGSVALTSSTVDQSVSVDVDGAPISRGNVLRVGQYDIGQVEVLKGPQALYFGKNSPAGVLVFKSSDPTPFFDSFAKLSYEPYGQTWLGDAMVSGPLTEDLGGRVFLHLGASDGSKDNLAALALPANAIAPGSVIAPSHGHEWRYDDVFGRVVLAYKPNDRFSLRLMASYDEQNGDGTGSFLERYSCPQGHAQTSTLAAVLLGRSATPASIGALAGALAVDDCRLNNKIYYGDSSSASLSAPGLVSRDPSGYARDRISVNVAQANLKLTDEIDLASVTSYALVGQDSVDNFSWSPADVGLLTFRNFAENRQVTQELRLTTHFRSPVNFMLGGFFEHATLRTFATSAALPPYNVFEFNIPNDVYSGFAQATWNVSPTIELSGGARITHEEKRLRLTRDGVLQPTANPSASFWNNSPEATLTWRPSQDLTAYVAYKTGFKSGGYGSTISGNGPPLPAAPLADFLYNPEKTKGFEIGFKAALFHALRVNATAYAYNYDDLQVTSVDASVTPPINRVLNAASAHQRGVDLEGVYYPPALPALRIDGAVNYNDAHYATFNSPCYIGQSISDGCNLNPTALGVFTEQSLAGRRLTNAPLWSGSLGFSYTHAFEAMSLEFGADAQYRSSYNDAGDLSPGAAQAASTLLSTHLRLIGRSWEIGIYGKNLTDVLRAQQTSAVPLTGNSAATGTARGGPSAWADLAANANPGRAVVIQLVLRPSEWLR